MRPKGNIINGHLKNILIETLRLSDMKSNYFLHNAQSQCYWRQI